MPLTQDQELARLRAEHARLLRDQERRGRRGASPSPSAPLQSTPARVMFTPNPMAPPPMNPTAFESGGDLSFDQWRPAPPHGGSMAGDVGGDGAPRRRRRRRRRDREAGKGIAMDQVTYHVKAVIARTLARKAGCPPPGFGARAGRRGAMKDVPMSGRFFAGARPPEIAPGWGPPSSRQEGSGTTPWRRGGVRKSFRYPWGGVGTFHGYGGKAAPPVKIPKPQPNPNPPPGSGELSDYDNLRQRVRDELFGTLGRDPTPDEFHPAFQQAKRNAKLYGHPVSGTNPDNPPPYAGGYQGGSGTQLQFPNTMTNYELRHLLREIYGKAIQSKEDMKLLLDVTRTYQREGRTYAIDPSGKIIRQKITASPIDPSAKIRPNYVYDDPYWNQFNIDPRDPERFDFNWNLRQPQNELDRVRREYYKKFPNLQPVQGQAGYDVWNAQQARGGG